MKKENHPAFSLYKISMKMHILRMLSSLFNISLVSVATRCNYIFKDLRGFIYEEKNATGFLEKNVACPFLKMKF